mmetsp:Transcript_20975/g.34869  ORF Transcript_20975/g.34869 Transcript_20975/m.34869 type:complete len:126 (-) Transcript_20975:40-417(-)
MPRAIRTKLMTVVPVPTSLRTSSSNGRQGATRLSVACQAAEVLQGPAFGNCITAATPRQAGLYHVLLPGKPGEAKASTCGREPLWHCNQASSFADVHSYPKRDECCWYACHFLTVFTPSLLINDS